MDNILSFYNRKNFSKVFFALFCCTTLIFSSSQFNNNFTNKAYAQTCAGTNLPLSGVTASGFQTGYPPSNAIDNDFGTRWSNSFIWFMDSRRFRIDKKHLQCRYCVV